ncbi:nitrile hydratase accessory protein [Paraburkholderia mimosarum]|uniref:nitrile hydratase accessory protein n=1 Tax=Paraburkholderia mimosarum TaxID=312026 RepID=UPI0039C3A045
MTDAVDYSSIGLPRDHDGPVFEKPWHAQVFSLTVQLSKVGLFTWSEWVSIFSSEIRNRPALPTETANEAYYRQWLAALERAISTYCYLTGPAIDARAQQWRLAYLNTPHGSPVSLNNAFCPPEHSHHALGASGRPIAVSAAQHH